MPSTAPRSLADELRRWDDDALVTLLEQRPDLAVPPPNDLGSLAVAAASRLSVQRAVDGLDNAALQVLEVLAVLPEPASSAEVARRWGAPATRPLATLRSLALLWGGNRSLRLVRAARDAVGPYPAGLGPALAEALGRRSPQRLANLMEDLGLEPAGDPDTALARLADHLGDPKTVNDLLLEGPEAARSLLDRLTWGPPVGAVEDADRPVRAGSARSPVEWLLAHGLLAVADPGHVVLPREVALALRGGRVQREAEVAPPGLSFRARPVDAIEGTAAQAAAEAVRLVDQLGELWGGTPLPVLRAGGIGVRELRRLAANLEVDEVTAALVTEVAQAAGLIVDDGEADPSWMPTARFDLWRDADTGERWAELTAAWLALPRAPGLVGTRGPKDVVVAALGPDVDRPAAAFLRGQALTDLAELTAADPGQALADASGADLLARLDWYAPRRRGASRAQLLSWTLREAAWLGVTGLGALSSFGRRMVADPAARADAAELLDAALPQPVDHILLQADLTAVAPGPLRPDLEHELAVMARIESRGGASVYRFSADTLRRALDAGRTGDDLLNWLTEHSRTEVPQPLSYLIADSARRYGRLRVGMAGAYLRADDESVLAEVLADKRAAPLRLRRLAPTVLAAQAPPETVLTVLRGMGLSPAAESPEGDLLVGRAATHRAAGVRLERVRRWPPAQPSRAELLRAITALRAVDANARRPMPDLESLPPAAMTPMDPVRVLGVLRQAVTTGQDVWLGVVEDAGRSALHVVQPLAVEGGRLRALERATGRIRSYLVARVFAAAPVRGVPQTGRAGADPDAGGPAGGELDEPGLDDQDLPVKGAG